MPARLRWVAPLFMVTAAFGGGVFWAVFRGVPGQDWVVFHTAAALARAGDWQTLADPQAFTDTLNRTHAAWFAAPLVFHPWVYPPVTLVLALAFGWLPYPLSLMAFLSVSLSALLAALWPWMPDRKDRALLAGGVLLCPATAFTLGAGQLSFLIAAFVVAGVRWLPSRPALAGAVLGLLCIKPQFAPLIPVALVAGRHWRAVGGAAASVTGLVVLSIVFGGLHPWEDWLRLAFGVNPAQAGLVHAVRIYDQSVHTCLLILGVSSNLAAMGQLLALAISALCVWRAFARPMQAELRLIVLLCATIFGAPHVGGYDHVLVAVACTIALLAGTPGLVVPAAGAWVATLLNPPALVALLGLPVLTVLSALTPLLVAALMGAAVLAGDVAMPARSRRAYRGVRG